MVTPSGVVTTFAGNGDWGHDREEGSKLEVAIVRPEALVFDSNGNLYVGENGRHRISKIDTNGNVTLVIGNGDHGDNDGGKTEAQFRSIDAMAFDSYGNLIVIDGGAEKVKKVTFDASSGQASVTTLAGSGSHEFADGAGVDAAFRHPNGIAIDANDNIYVSDRHNHRIRKVAPDGTVSTFAGAGWGDEDGSLVNARFRQPAGLHITSSGDLYVAEREGPRIRFIDVSEGTVSTLAGEVDSYGHTDGSFESARFKRPLGITASSSSLYISDEDAHKIREIKLLPQIIIPAGQTSGKITLSGMDDIIYEAGESISVAVSSVTNASNSVGDFSVVNATILSEDAAPIVKISASDDILEEKGAGTLNVKVSLSDVYSSSKTDMDISEKPDYYYLGEYKGSKYYSSRNHNEYGHLNFSDAHARATELGGQLAIITSAGEQEAVVDGIFKNDPDYQRDDNRWLNHWIGYEYNSDNDEWGWKNNMVSGFEAWRDNWQKNEHPNRKGAWLHSDGSWHSGRSGDTRRYVIEYSSATSDSDTTVGITFEDTNSSGVTLTGAGADFTSNLSNGNFTIGAGNPSANIVLTAVNDDIDESVESFSVKLASATGATVDSNSENTTVSVIISDDEKPEVSLSIANNVSTISEVGGQASIEASIQKTKLFPVTVDLAFADSGNLIALFGNDYQSKDLNAVSNWVGKGRNGYVDGGSDEAEFSNNIRNMTNDAQGNIYVADTENRAIRKIDTDGNVTTWAGGGDNGHWEGEQDKLSIRIEGPTGMTFDSSGNAYITAAWHNNIIKINAAGKATVWANEKREHGRNNGPVDEATFKSPRDIVFDSQGNMFVLENHSIRKIVFSGASAVVEDFVGNGDWGQEDGVGTAARFSDAWNLVIDSNDNIFFADIHHNKIRMVTPDAVVTTIAGNGNWGYSDGLGVNARFRNPYGIALDSNNDILVNDTENNRIRKIDISRDSNGKVTASNVSTLAGNGNYGTANGTADVAEFKRLEAMIVVNGVLYTYDRDESMFRQILLNPVMTIPAGSLSASFDITGIDDSVYESDETISVTPSTSQGTLASSDPLSLTITSDELTPKVEISSFDTVVDENGQAIAIYVGLTDSDGAASLWENTELPNSVSPSYDFMGEFGGHKYYFSRFRQNYSQALSIAEELGGRLLVIESQEENDFIGSIMIHDGTWIGHYRGDSDSSWKNIYGNSTYTNYANSNDFIDRSGYAFTYGNQWYNNDPNNENHFIIEYGPVTSSELESKVQLVLTGTAENGVDYVLSSSDAVIPAGSTNVKIDLSGKDDNLEEPIETIKIDLALINDNDGNSLSNVNLGDKISLELQVNDDEVPLVTFSNSNNEISENGGNTVLTANLSNEKLYPTTINLDLQGDSEVLVDYNASSILSYKPFVGGLKQSGSSAGKMESVRLDRPVALSQYNSYKYPDGSYEKHMMITDHDANVVNIARTDGALFGQVDNLFGIPYDCCYDEADTMDKIRLSNISETTHFQGIIGQDGLSISRPSLIFFYDHNRIFMINEMTEANTKIFDGDDGNQSGQIGGIEAVERNGVMEIYFTDRNRHTLNKLSYGGDGTDYTSNWTFSRVAGQENSRKNMWDDFHDDGNGSNEVAFTTGYDFNEGAFNHPSTLTYDALNDRMIISTGSFWDDWDEKARIQIADFANQKVYSLRVGRFLELTTNNWPNFGQIGVDSKGALYVPITNYNRIIKVDFTYDNNGKPIYGNEYISKTISDQRIDYPQAVLVTNGKAFVANEGSNVVDEINLNANITIPSGQKTAQIVLAAFKDPYFENDEIIDVNIGSISNGYATVVDNNGNQTKQSDIVDVTIVESTKLTLVDDVPFQGVENGKISWGDYDKDGDMDLALMGSASTGTITNVYINNDGKFVNTNQSFTKFIGGDIEFVDVDQDGFLDVAVSGNAEGGIRKSELYRNVLGAFFEKMDEYNVEGLSQTDMEWGDLDNDGDPDLIISGIDSKSAYVTLYYTNLGDFNFLQENLFYDRGVIKGEIDIVDADQDGDNDLFITGTNINQNIHSNALRNTYVRASYEDQGKRVDSDGNTMNDDRAFYNVEAGFKNGNTIYADIDGDGELDFLAMGENQQGNIDIRTNLAALDNLPKLKNVDFDFADYNNDGQSDLIISGEDINTNSAVTKLFTSFPNLFGGQYGIIETDAVLLGLRESSVDWIDYDMDGDLDLFLTGLDDNGLAQAKLYKAENTNNLNTAPSKITGLKHEHDGFGGVKFSWDVPTDNVSNTFRYDIRIGTTSGGSEIIYANSDLETGNTLINIPSLSTLNERGVILNPGTYYASVQAIDGGNVGGPFSDEIEIKIDYEWKLLNLGGIIDRRLIPTESTQLEFMDMDGDGDKDLISTNVGMRANRFGDSQNVNQRAINIYAFDNEVFVPIDLDFQYYGKSNFAFGDLNNDGEQDIVVAIEEQGGTRIRVLLNTRDEDDAREDDPNTPRDEGLYRSFFREHHPFQEDDYFPNLFNIEFAISDLNNDGLVEIIAAGQSSKLSDEATAVITMFSVVDDNPNNTTLGFDKFSFSDQKSLVDNQDTIDKLKNLSFASYDFGDMDNDGDFDFLISGYSFGGYKTLLLENKRKVDEDGIVVQPIEVYFEENSNEFVSVKEGTTQFVDFDADGKLDILFSGQSQNGDLVKAYKNQGLVGSEVLFDDLNVGLPAVREGKFVFGDFDSNGFKDVVYSGVVAGQGKITKLSTWVPPLGVMVDSPYDVSMFEKANVGIADFDGDFDADIVITGKNKFDNSNDYYTQYISEVLINVRGFAGEFDGADDDSNGIARDGSPLKKSIGVKKVYGLNSRPNAPTKIDMQRQRISVVQPDGSDGGGDKISSNAGSNVSDPLFELVITWSGATDNWGDGKRTPAAGLTYSVRIGTTSGGEEILASGADIDGVKAVADAGNAENNLSWKLNVPLGEYFVAVQSIDASFVGSPWSEEKAYTVKSSFQLGDSNGDDIVNILDLTTNLDVVLGKNPKVFVGEVADVNNDGLITVQDISGIVSLILNANSGVAQGANYDPYDWDYISNKPVGEATLVHSNNRVYLENEKPVTSLQFSIDATVDYELSEELEELSVVTFVKEGKRNFLIYSYNNQPINELTNILFDYVDVNENEEFKIEDLFAGTNSGLSLDLRYSDERLFDSIDDSIKLYPIPADSNINLLTNVSKKAKKLEVNIYNILGVLVHDTTIETMGRLNDIDVSMLSSGLYNVEVKMITSDNEEIVSVHKIIKK
tara:strand:+ start:13 stop:9702 length:9690 start_codon:yes stop_codon:yes gene_type:complete